MPYIVESDRNEVKSGRPPQTAGELNYILSITIKDYLDRKGTSYTVLNEIVGVIESVKVEFNRRVMTPYEDKKIKENGDIY